MEDFLRACRDAVKDNEPKDLAAKMGLPHVSLLQRANPDDDAHRLTVEHLFGILLHAKDMRPLQALAAEFGYELVAKAVVEAKNLTSALLHMSAEVADVTRAVTNALDDGHVSQTEKHLIKRELAGARESLEVLEASVKAA